MKKPEWADEWREEEFDYGASRAFCAQVGPLRNAVRHYGLRCVEKAVYGPMVTREQECWCDDCQTYHTHTVEYRKTITPAKYKPVVVDEQEVEATLRAWFMDKTKEAREYIARAEENGW